jgi:hypothetical protein
MSNEDVSWSRHHDPPIFNDSFSHPKRAINIILTGPSEDVIPNAKAETTFEKKMWHRFLNLVTQKTIYIIRPISPLQWICRPNLFCKTNKAKKMHLGGA